MTSAPSVPMASTPLTSPPPELLASAWTTAQDEAKTVPVLVVGAGGIGCEVVKNLVLAGFSKLTLLDLDTIDVTNLNRQFLFQRQHVGMSKAKVARETAISFVGGDVEIEAIHDDIMT